MIFKVQECLLQLEFLSSHPFFFLCLKEERYPECFLGDAAFHPFQLEVIYT